METDHLRANGQCARARNIIILQCRTKNRILLLPESRQRINSRRPVESHARGQESENRETRA